MICQAGIFFFVALKLLFLILLYRASNVFSMFITIKIAGNDKKICALLNLLAINRVEVAFAKREVVYGIKQIGFTRAVIARKSIYTRAKRKLGIGVIFKINNR